jgi:hypothetical protein
VRWDARTLDVDVLLYDGICIEHDDLTIPHPRMICRRFVLEPAAEIARDWIHPITQWTIGKLLDNLNTIPHRFALCGFGSLGLQEIVAKIAHDAGINIVSSTAKDAPAARVTSAGGLFLAESARHVTAISPKLCIVPTALGFPDQRQLMRDLNSRLIKLRVAPVLTITNPDPNVVVAESVAAIEAMK